MTKPNAPAPAEGSGGKRGRPRSVHALWLRGEGWAHRGGRVRRTSVDGHSLALTAGQEYRCVWGGHEVQNAEGSSNAACDDQFHAGLRDVELSACPTTLGRRATGAALTSEDLGLAWPEISRALGRFLRSRGAAPHEVDDISQTVALKALTERRPILNPTAWCIRAARNAHVDLQRRARALETPDYSLQVDPADVVCLRDQCDRTLSAVAALPDRDRELLVRAANGVRAGQDRKAATARHVQVHRLRRRLRHEVFGPLVGVVAAYLASIRGRRFLAGAAIPAAMLLPLLLSPLLQPPVAVPVHQRPPAAAAEVQRISTSSLPSGAGEAATASVPSRSTASSGAPIGESDGGIASRVPRRASVVQDTPVGPVGVETHPEDRRGHELACVRDVVPGVGEQCVDAPRDDSSR